MALYCDVALNRGGVADQLVKDRNAKQPDVEMLLHSSRNARTSFSSLRRRVSTLLSSASTLSSVATVVLVGSSRTSSVIDTLYRLIGPNIARPTRLIARRSLATHVLSYQALRQAAARGQREVSWSKPR